ncbi:MAG: agmatinase family protein [Candidatus Cyclobacteriaceae bacterium M2_1C_046]
MNKEEILESFDPNGPALTGKIFGLPFDEENAEIIIVPVPWEVTVSYSEGTADGPSAILQASTQVDLFLKSIPNAWTAGIYMLPIPEDIKNDSDRYRETAAKYIRWLEESGGEEIPDSVKIIPDTINDVSEKLNIYVQSKTRKYLQRNKLVGLLGGDHSTPIGFIRALGEFYKDFGILQLDAHADLRKAYEDFTYSHASIMYNALGVQQVSKLVQVGIRDLCQEEFDVIQDNPDRIITFFDEDLKQAMYEGQSWKTICNKIVDALPQHVYISFDIDGLDPKLCPNTGTPVPGGFEFHQAVYLIQTVVSSGRKIIGFDLNEVSPGKDEWDANVGARLLYNMSNLMAASHGKLSLNV